MRRKPIQRIHVSLLLRWADAHHRRTGKWPKVNSGPIHENPDDTWTTINSALRAGVRGLPRYRGLAQLLEERRGVRNSHFPPPLSVRQILKWADAHRDRTGRWPKEASGKLADAPEETWNAIDQSLSRGRRGLPGGSSLAQVLARHRGKRNHRTLPRLTYTKVLAWADEHRRRTGRWPRHNSGPIVQEPGTTWNSIDTALAHGGRGLPGGTTLAKLLAKYRGLKITRGKTPRPRPTSGLTIRQILGWADQHHRRTHTWPKSTSGTLPNARGLTWRKIDLELLRRTGQTPRGSLARLLQKHRGVRNVADLPPLSIRQILTWADAHRKRHKEWPKSNSGPVAGVPGETWSSIQSALTNGRRGLKRGYTLPRLLATYRGVHRGRSRGRLSIPQIVEWIEDHKARTGKWPTSKGGEIKGVPGESWNAVNIALNQGLRGLPPGYTLRRLREAYGLERKASRRKSRETRAKASSKRKAPRRR